MRAELRRVHTLYAGDSIAEITRMRNEQWVFEHIRSFAQATEKEICTGIFCRLIIAETLLPLVTAQYVYRLHSGCTHVFHVNIFHIAVNAQFDSNFNLVANFQYVALIYSC